MFDRIVVPLDGRPEGRDALRVAERLADHWDTSLELLSLVTQPTQVRGRTTTVESQAQNLHRTHGTVIAERSTFVADSAINTAAIDARTLVVMATSARNRSESFYGSVAEEFLNHLHEPVLLVGPNAEIADDWPAGPMMVCSDGSAFSDQILPAAREWADGLGLVPWSITVAEPSGALLMAGSESAHVARLAKELSVGSDRVPAYDVLHGKAPAKAILEYAKSHHAPLIAMSTQGRTGLRRLALGSVTMAVVHDAHCPVLVVNPPPPAESLPAPDVAISADPIDEVKWAPSHFTVSVMHHSVVVHIEDAPTREAAEALRQRFEQRDGVDVEITEVWDPRMSDLTAHTRELVTHPSGEAARGEPTS